MNTACAIGVDLGGTKCAAGLVQLDDGQVHARRIDPTRAERGGQAALALIVDQIHFLQAEARNLQLAPQAVGVGVPELVDVAGRLASDATIKWQDFDIPALLKSATQLPARLEADVRAAARAEAVFGAGRGYRSLVYVTVGTGISASLVMDGEPYLGARGLTGSIASSRGLIPADSGELAGGPPLEQFAAGPAIAARYVAAARSGDSLKTPEIIALAEAGDETAATIVRTSGEAIGTAIAHLVNTLDPEAVVIGGGLGLVLGLFRNALEQSFREHVWSELHRTVPILSAKCGVDAGLIGAALAVREATC